MVAEVPPALPSDAFAVSPWLGAAAVACLPATVIALRRVWRWMSSGRPLPLPDGQAMPASRIPAPFDLVLFAAMFLSGFLILIVYEAMAKAGLVPWERGGRVDVFSPAAFVAQTAPAALGLVAAARFGRGVLGSIGVRAGDLRRSVLLGAWSAVLVLPLCVAGVLFSGAVFLVLRIEVQVHPLLERLAAGRSAGVLLLVLVQASVLAPLAEEFMYRGVLMMGLLKYLRPMGALVVSSGLFALVHLPSEPQALLSLFLLGLALGWAAWRTRSLVAPIIAHSVFNTVMVLTGFFGA